MKIRRGAEMNGSRYSIGLAAILAAVSANACATDSLGVSLGSEPNDPAYSELRRQTDVTVPTALGTCTPGDCTPDEL